MKKTIKVEPTPIAVARVIGVQGRTLVLGPVLQATVVASEQRETLLEAPQPSQGGALTTSGDDERYSLLGCVGRGTMGEIHIARDNQLLRRVALKRVVPELATHDPLVPEPDLRAVGAGRGEGNDGFDGKGGVFQKPPHLPPDGSGCSEDGYP